MTDYIRKAVELADGWSGPNGVGQVVTSGGGYFGNIDDQEILDALAAQLARQVDALGDDLHLEVHRGWTAMRKNGSSGWSDIAAAYGPDRTMNTILTIIDSGVLE